MGKFAGFLKRAKRLAGIGSGILGTINNLYKSVKPAVDTVVGLLPGGGFINTVLSGASKGIDMIQPYTNKWIKDSDQKTFNSMNKTAETMGNFIMSSPLGIADRVANRILDKTSPESGMNSNGTPSSNSIFGKPLNWSSNA